METGLLSACMERLAFVFDLVLQVYSPGQLRGSQVICGPDRPPSSVKGAFGAALFLGLEARALVCRLAAEVGFEHLTGF